MAEIENETPDIPAGFPEDRPIELPPEEPKEGDIRPPDEAPPIDIPTETPPSPPAESPPIDIPQEAPVLDPPSDNPAVG